MKTSNEERLRALYRRIPSFECEPGCSECCGPILMCKTELARFKESRSMTSADLTCPYLVGGRCSEYDNRPFICRIYGTTGDWEGSLICPKGRGPKKPLRLLQQLRIANQYETIASSEGMAVGPALSLLKLKL